MRLRQQVLPLRTLYEAKTIMPANNAAPRRTAIAIGASFYYLNLGK